MLNNFTNILGAIALAIAIIKVYLIVRKLLLDESNIKIKQTNSVRVKLSRSSVSAIVIVSFFLNDFLSFPFRLINGKNGHIKTRNFIVGMVQTVNCW